MKVYTRTGDAGTTSLVGGTRVSKASPRLEAYGTVDELNSYIGVVLACPDVPVDVRSTLSRSQHRLFNLGAQLATEPDSKWQPDGVTAEDVAEIEAAIDKAEESLPRHNRFILPGGRPAAAHANVARTIARRAERCMVAMTQDGIEIAPPAMQYINRLSDYLFVAARQINHEAGADETFWEK